MHIGPDHLIVAAQVGFDDNISADRAEDVADGIDHRLTDRLPLVPHVFLDPTQTSSGSRPGPPPDQAHPEAEPSLHLVVTVWPSGRLPVGSWVVVTSAARAVPATTST
jgi:hypothetical protein